MWFNNPLNSKLNTNTQLILMTTIDSNFTLINPNTSAAVVEAGEALLRGGPFNSTSLGNT